VLFVVTGECWTSLPLVLLVLVFTGARFEVPLTRLFKPTIGGAGGGGGGGGGIGAVTT